MKRSRVQYMRPYTVHELALLQVEIQKLLAKHPALVGIAAMAQNLHLSLTDVRGAEPTAGPPPPRVQSLIDALDDSKGLFIRMCVEGVVFDEVVS